MLKRTGGSGSIPLSRVSSNKRIVNTLVDLAVLQSFCRLKFYPTLE